MQQRYALLCALFGAFSAGCYPGEIETAAQTDLVATFHMEGADYSANHTFAMPDSIVDVSVAAGFDTSLNHAHDAAILAKVAGELTAMGYVRIDPDTARPDMVILVSAITVDNYDVWYSYPWYPYWGWWGGWDGYYPYGYSANSTYYYPWYPVTVTGYTTGSVFIHMLDPDVVPSDSSQATPIWVAAINGLVTGTDQQILTRIDNNITQAFAQSPYLRTQ